MKSTRSRKELAMNLKKEARKGVQGYKFKFDDDDGIKDQRTQSDMEIENLFEEMNQGLDYDEDSLAHGIEQGENQDEDDKCFKDEHDFSLNEEAGVICKRCSFVQIEVKDMIPCVDRWMAREDMKGWIMDKQGEWNVEDEQGNAIKDGSNKRFKMKRTRGEEVFERRSKRRVMVKK